MRAPKEPRIKLREPTDRILFIFAPVVPIIAFTAIAGDLSDSLGLTGAIAATLIIMSPVGFVFWRAVIAGVFVEERGLTVTNLFKTYTFDWTQIEHFEFGYPEAWVWTWSPVAVLNDGTRIQLMPIQAPQPLTRPKNTYDKQAVAELEEFHAAATRNGGILPREVLLYADDS